MIGYLALFLIIHSSLITPSCSKSIIKTLPGYPGDLPFTLETGYVGIGEKEEIQLFYYFVESSQNPEKDPLIFHICGGPGGSGLLSILVDTGPLTVSIDNLTLTLNPDAWTQVANMIFVDLLAGTGFSYSETQEGWSNSDTILVSQAKEFIKKFMRDHPKFLSNPLYVYGISYSGIVVPKVTLELYEGNERGDQPTFNIQGYILCSPLIDKFMSFNSRFEYAYRVALISDDIHRSGIHNCDGNYVDINWANSACANTLKRYEECTSHIKVQNILEPYCDETNPNLDCLADTDKAIDAWANMDVAQQALNVRQGMIGKWESLNNTWHYELGMNDTIYYSYDIFSSFPDHKKLLSKNCRALIFNGDHDLAFPYVGVERWIASLDLDVEVPWKPFYVNDQVGGYETKYSLNNYSLAYATVKGSGHVVPQNKPTQTVALVRKWLSSQTYSSTSDLR
ncbi:hypothetical protein QVD17_35254 [Tagetes erecta]|uniref:Peptidase S10, serine carboxypeptidase, Alpha/Beta hydrolase fold protein n=1 Tax=Tagetes erecta TaxID=13708 RepID=A0AAD8JZ29_TARER|nr:hypothetical protein QVD17_35254 [Tagetes erecta]